jgi:hypothetical protein
MKILTLVIIAALTAAAHTPEEGAEFTGGHIDIGTGTVTATALSANNYVLSAGGSSTEDVAPSVAPVAVQPPRRRTAAPSARSAFRRHVMTAILCVAVAIAWIYSTGHP